MTRFSALLLTLFLIGPATAQTGVADPDTGNAAPGSFIDVTGSVTYRQRMALPPGALLVVTVQDSSRADGPAQLLAEQRFVARGAQVPIPFTLTIDRDLVSPGARITVSARIQRGKQLLFATDRIYPVLTNDQPANADLILVAVADTRR